MKRGRVAVVGPKSVWSSLEGEFSRRFAAVRFFDYSSLKLTAGSSLSVSMDGLDLTVFDYVLVLPDTSRAEFYQTLVRILEKTVRTSVPSRTLEFFWNKPIMWNVLSEGGIRLPEMAVISQDVAFDYIKESFKLPVVLTTPQGKEVYVTNETTLKNVLELFPAGHTILVRKPLRSDELYVTFSSMGATFGYVRAGDRRTPIKIDDRLAKLSRKVREVLDVDFCVSLFYRKGKSYYLYDVRLLPNFERFNEVAGKNVARIMAVEIQDSLQFGKTVAGLIGKVKEFFRWLKDEIGNTRSPE